MTREVQYAADVLKLLIGRLVEVEANQGKNVKVMRRCNLRHHISGVRAGLKMAIYETEQTIKLLE